MNTWYKKISAYMFPILLLSSIVCGGLTGYGMGKEAIRLKPLGDIFLNLLFTAIVPLVFFSVSSSMIRIGQAKRLWKILFAMLSTFIFTGMVAAIVMMIVVTVFPLSQNMILLPTVTEAMTNKSFTEQLVGIFTVSDFTKLFSHNSILPLIFFSILLGLATSTLGEKGKPVARILQSGADISMKLISFIMYYAPIGFFAYFAVLVGDLGTTLVDNYVRVTLIYYVTGILYFIVAFTCYAYLANKNAGVKQFWKHVILPMMTSLATCSSAASIPANLAATKKMGISPSIYETVIPLGAILHKDGSVLGGMIKIAFLFGVFHMPFSGASVLLTALLIAILVGTVMGAIPSGGMLGEMLILSFYGFPPQALIIIAAISIIIDPLATMLNVTGDIVCSMMVGKLVEDPVRYQPDISYSPNELKIS